MEFESDSDKNKNLSGKEYLNEIKPYLKDIKTSFHKSGTWKIKLKIAINLISSKDNNEEEIMHSKSDNVEVMTYGNANSTIERIFESLLSRYQIGLGTSTKGSNFIFDLVQLLYYKCHKMNFKHRSWYINFPRLEKKEKSDKKSEK